VVHEDADLLVINKQAGLVCHPTKGDAYSSLIGRVRLYLGPAERPHLVNRLDRETSGIVLVAKRDEAAREIRRLWESRAIEKEYLAIVHGHLPGDAGTIDAPLGKDESSRVAVKDRVRPDGLPSQTRFEVLLRFHRRLADTPGIATDHGPRTNDVGPRPPRLGCGMAWQAALRPPPSALRPLLARLSPFTLLRVLPLTGRKHQIRIHLAHLGHPVVGDKLYGGDEDLYLALVEDRLTDGQRRRLILSNQALHARAVRFNWRDKICAFECQAEPIFNNFVA